MPVDIVTVNNALPVVHCPNVSGNSNSGANSGGVRLLRDAKSISQVEVDDGGVGNELDVEDDEVVILRHNHAAVVQVCFIY